MQTWIRSCEENHDHLMARRLHRDVHKSGNLFTLLAEGFTACYGKGSKVRRRGRDANIGLYNFSVLVEPKKTSTLSVNPIDKNYKKLWYIGDLRPPLLRAGTAPGSQV